MKRIIIYLFFTLLCFTVKAQNSNLFFNYYVNPEFIPTDIAGCDLWLRADLGITKDGSDYVSNWADQSGNGNDASQGTGANQPLYVADGTPNHKAVIRFDGNNDFLQTAAFSSALTQPYSVYIVGNSSNETYFSSLTNNVVLRIDFANYKLYMGSNASYIGGRKSTYPTPNNIYKAVYNGDYSTLTINGFQVIGGTLPNTLFDGLSLGYTPTGGFYLNGDVVEVIIYSNVVSEADDYNIQYYLSQKYGITYTQFNNIIPIMTSNTAPSGVVSYSSQVWAAWCAFNHKLVSGADEGWLASASYPQSLTYQLPVSKTVTKYSVTYQYDSNNYAIKDWELQASNTGVFGGEETILDTQTGITDWIDNATQSYSFSNSTAYLYYRLYITGGNNGTFIFVSELQMSE